MCPSLHISLISPQNYYFINIPVYPHKYATASITVSRNSLRTGQYHHIRPRNPFIIHHPIRVPLRRLHLLQAGTRFFKSLDPRIPNNAALLRTAGYSSIQCTGKMWSIVIFSLASFLPQYAHRYLPDTVLFFAKNSFR